MLGNLFKSKDSDKQEPDKQYNEEIATEINNEYKRRMMERKPFEMQMRLNMEFLNGNQYLDIDPVSLSILDIPKLYDHQEREVFNQIATIHETRSARMTRQKPAMKTRPASSDDMDISAAKVSSMLLTSSWADQNMDIEYSDMIPWMEVCGTVFLKPIWSTRKGRVIGKRYIPDQNYLNGGEDEALPGEIQTEAFDQQLGRGLILETIREGDIDTCVVPAFEIFPDSSWRNGMKQVRSMIHARAYHVDEIEDMWDERVEPEQVDVMTLQKGGNAGGLGYSSAGFRAGVVSLKNHAVLKEYYELPTRKYPQGRFIVVAGTKTLHVGPMPYMIGEYGEPDIPFIRFVSIDHPGCFWGKTITERCIPIQRRYNALRNRIAEYLNRVAIGQWYNPDGCLDEDSELNNAPGNIINYRNINGAKPEPVQFPSLPVDFQREENALLSEFTSISGVSELSRFSEAPSGVKSGVALGVATEQDDTRLATTVTNIANGIVTLGKYWLRLYRQNVKEPRMLRSIGASRDVEVKEWYVSQLRSDDVFIENSSALAETPSQRRNLVFDLINAGLFDRPETNRFTEDSRQKIFQMLEFGHWESGAEDMALLQKSRAKRENHQFMTAEVMQPMPIMDFDDDVIHLEHHNRMRMSADYESLMKTPIGPLINMLVIQHQDMHIQRFQKAQMQQQMQMILASAKAVPPTAGENKESKPA